VTVRERNGGREAGAMFLEGLALAPTQPEVGRLAVEHPIRGENPFSGRSRSPQDRVAPGRLHDGHEHEQDTQRGEEAEEDPSVRDRVALRLRALSKAVEQTGR
jgi:hypothetical protein